MKKIPTIILSITYKGVKFIDASNKVGFSQALLAGRRKGPFFLSLSLYQLSVFPRVSPASLIPLHSLSGWVLVSPAPIYPVSGPHPRDHRHVSFSEWVPLPHLPAHRPLMMCGP